MTEMPWVFVESARAAASSDDVGALRQALADMTRHAEDLEHRVEELEDERMGLDSGMSDLNGRLEDALEDAKELRDELKTVRETSDARARDGDDLLAENLDLKRQVEELLRGDGHHRRTADLQLQVELLQSELADMLRAENERLKARKGKR